MILWILRKEKWWGQINYLAWLEFCMDAIQSFSCIHASLHIEIQPGTTESEMLNLAIAIGCRINTSKDSDLLVYLLFQEIWFGRQNILRKMSQLSVVNEMNSSFLFLHLLMETFGQRWLPMQVPDRAHQTLWSTHDCLHMNEHSSISSTSDESDCR